MYSISIRPTSNITKHDNTATFCEIRNCVEILFNLGMVSHRISTVYGFWWNIVILIVLVYAVGGYWIITLSEKIWQYKCVHDKAYFNVLFGSEYIVNGYHLWKWQCFRCCKYVVGLLWHSSIWNFVMKNKEKKIKLMKSWNVVCVVELQRHRLQLQVNVFFFSF